MATSKPITLQVSDLIQWFRNKELVVNETFQRHSVWTSAAKTYFIDTILNELPIPKIFIRTMIDSKRQTSVREVVDGQQRVRTLVEFANNKLALTKKSENFSGCTYSSLDPADQERFLGYTVTVEQLLNATYDDVIDIFARINSYTVSLNAAEKRHAKYQTEFKFAVRKATQTFRWFIEKYNVFTLKRRFRMSDDTFFADIYGLALEGVKDGGEAYLNKLYERQSDDLFTDAIQAKCKSRIAAALRFLDEQLGDAIKGEFSKHYHLLMLIASYFHTQYGLPPGDLAELPERGKLRPAGEICDGLAKLEEVFERDPIPRKWEKFVEASSARPERIASRAVRFPVCHQLMTS